MKTNKLFMVICLLICTISVISAQTKNNKTIEFKVTGNCEMCKKTIESSLKGKAGISSAIWNKNTKIIKVVYDDSKISEEAIHKLIADSGYDTEKVKASDKSYSSLPECCQYERTMHKKK